MGRRGISYGPKRVPGVRGMDCYSILTHATCHAVYKVISNNVNR